MTSFNMLDEIVLSFVAGVTLTAVMKLLLMSTFDVPLQIASFGVYFITNYTLMPQVTADALAIVFIANNAICIIIHFVKVRARVQLQYL